MNGAGELAAAYPASSQLLGTICIISGIKGSYAVPQRSVVAKRIALVFGGVALIVSSRPAYLIGVSLGLCSL
jgi:hypothetical protein